MSEDLEPPVHTRREVLAGGAVLAATALLLAWTARWPQAGRGPEPSGIPADWPHTLPPEHLAMVASVASHILPTDETPGAAEAQVHLFIDVVVGELMSPRARRVFAGGLDALDRLCVEQHGTPYLKSPAEAQLALLSQLDREAQGGTQGAGFEAALVATLKELTVIGFMTAKIATRHHTLWRTGSEQQDSRADRVWAAFREG